MPPNARYEANDITVQGCFFRGGTAAAAFVGVDGAKIEFNTILHPGKWAFRILQETRDPSFVPTRKGVVRKNLIVFLAAQWGEGGVNIGPGTDPSSFKFEQNFWYCSDRPAGSRPKLPTPESGGVIGADPMLSANPSRTDAVRDGSPAKKVGAHAFLG